MAAKASEDTLMQKPSAENNPATSPGTDPVQAQYEQWVYPPRVYDLAALPLTTPQWHFDDLRALFWLFWPQAPAVRDDLDILVAGCGSLAAAAQAYLHPHSRVVGIDVSRTSLEHEEFLKQKHNLTNLTLRQLPLEDVSSLGASFDFINCYGVLHHTADPARGLRALGQVLRPDGVIDIMVYGKYGRLGVTAMQEMFRVMGVEQSPAGVQIVKDTLAALPPNHPVQNYRRLAARDLASDEGLVDTFLHRRDRPFSVTECLELVEQAGLRFQGWKENARYHLDLHLSPNDPLTAHLRTLSERQLWQSIEMLDASIAGHWFYVCRTDRDPATYKIQFDDDAFLKYIPVSRVSQTTPADRLRRKPAQIARPPFPAVGLDERQAAIFGQFDGKHSIADCLAATAPPGGAGKDTDWARRFFSSLWRTGYAMFRLPGGTV
jgi:SAM-dependent methyltransferase